MTSNKNPSSSLNSDSTEFTIVYVDRETPVYTITIVSRITNLHPQTLRQYDKLGLVVPYRVNGKNRLYSHNDVEKLLEIKQLTKDNINLAGIRRILELQNKVSILENIINKTLK